jgi:hypothetical protein
MSENEALDRTPKGKPDASHDLVIPSAVEHGYTRRLVTLYNSDYGDA